MAKGRLAFFLKSRSNVQLYGMFTVLLAPLVIYLYPTDDVGMWYGVMEAGEAGDAWLFTLRAFVIAIHAINCLFAIAAYDRKKDKGVALLGLAAAMMAGSAIAGTSSLLRVSFHLLAFGALAAALIRSRKRILGAVLIGIFLLIIGLCILFGSAYGDRIWLFAGVPILLTVLLLQLTSHKQVSNIHKNGLRVLLICSCSSVVAVMASSAAAQTAAISFIAFIYQSIAGIVLFVSMVEKLVQFPVRAFARLQRLRQASLDKQQSQILLVEQQWQAEKDKMADISRAITGGGKLTGFLEQVVNDAAQAIGSEHVFLSLLEGQPQLFWVVAYKSSFQPIETSLENKFMGKKYAEGQMICLDDIDEFLPRLRPEVARAGLKAMIGVPIIIEGKLAGTFEIFSKRQAGFSENHKKLARFYAEQSAIAVKIDRLNEDSARKSDELALLHEVVRVVTDQPSPTMLLAKVGKMLNDFLWADAFAAFVVQRHLNPPLVRAVHSQDFAPQDIGRLEALFAKGQLAGLRQDSSDNEHFAKLLQPVLVPLTLASGKTVSVLPLFFRQTLQGVIVFLWDYDRKANRYSHTEDTLTTIATQVAMGLDRDYLYGSIQKIGLTDNLTGIANRRFFDYTLKRELLRVRRYGRPLSLLMVDIDFFKRINDQYGHPVGDRVLQEMGKLLRSLFRATDLPARYGGEEFAVILPETPAVAAHALAEKLRDQGAKKIFDPTGERISLTISIGAATVESGTQGHKITEADLILAADQALYRAKHTGRNRVEVGKWGDDQYHS